MILACLIFSICLRLSSILSLWYKHWSWKHYIFNTNQFFKFFLIYYNLTLITKLLTYFQALDIIVSKTNQNGNSVGFVNNFINWYFVFYEVFCKDK